MSLSDILIFLTKTSIMLTLHINIDFIHYSIFMFTLIFKNRKNLLHNLKFLYLWKYFINQNKNNIFMTRKDWWFCEQNLQSVTSLHKKLRIFSTLILLFFKIISIAIFHSTVAFQRHQICQILINVQKSIMTRKISAFVKLRPQDHLNEYIKTWWVNEVVHLSEILG